MEVEDPKKPLYLKVLLNQRGKGPQDPIHKLLPQKAQGSLQGVQTTETKLDQTLIYPPVYLAKIHYSWLKEFLETLPKDEAPYYLSALDKKKRDEILKVFPIDKNIPESSGFVKEFIQKKWIENLIPKDFIPLPFLPKNDLDPLYTLSKNELIDLIGSLGLIDLAFEVKKMVDTKKLKAVYAALNPKKVEFIKSYLNQKEKIQTPRFDLSDWQGDARDLEMRIHKRGLRRLHLSLYKEHPSKLWLLTRTLDTGRGKLLEEPIKEEINPHIVHTLTLQVLEIMKKVNRG